MAWRSVVPRLPIHQLQPVPGRIGDPAWALSTYRGPCRLEARDAAEARRLADGRFLVPFRPAQVPAEVISPWRQPDLVEVIAELGPPGPDEPPPLALVVEDQALVAMTIESCLTESGYAVVPHACGQPAIAAIAAGAAVNLLVTGLRLPDVHGGAVIEALWAHRPGTPVIVSTGAAELPPALAIQAAAGMLGYLEKPWPEAELGAMVRRLGRWA